MPPRNDEAPWADSAARAECVLLRLRPRATCSTSGGSLEDRWLKRPVIVSSRTMAPQNPLSGQAFGNRGTHITGSSTPGAPSTPAGSGAQA